MKPGQRPIVCGRELRWRWWLMRVDVERRRYVFFHDVERFDEATLFVSAAISLCASDFVVLDAETKTIAHDSREVRKKLAAQKDEGAGPR